MELNIIVDDYSMKLNVPEEYLAASGESFERLDRSMDQGVQMGRDWLESPDNHQRCQ